MASDDPVWLKDYTPKQADPEWLKNYTKKSEPYKDPITAASEKVAPAAGRIAVESLPFAGSFFGPGGTLIGTGISQAMKRAKPEIFGEQPQGMEAAGDAAKELVLNNLLPAGLGKLGGLLTRVGMQGPGRVLAESMPGMPAVREGMAKQIAKRVSDRVYPETGIIEQGAANTEQTFANSPHLFQQNEVGQKLFNLHNEYSNLATDPVRTQGYKDIANKTLSDVTHVQNAKLVAGPEYTNDLAVRKLLTGSTSAADNSINASRALDELGGKNAEIYKEAMNPASYDSLKNLLTTMKGFEEKSKSDMVLNYSKHKLLWSGAGLVTGGLTGSALGHPIAGALIGGTPMVLNGILDRVMANPETAKLVTLALTTPAKAPQATLINKALSEALPRLFQVGADYAATPNQ